MARPVYCAPTRVCRDCGIGKPVAEMYATGPKGRKYVSARCVECQAKFRSRYYEAHRDPAKNRAHAKRWRDRKTADGTLARYELSRTLRRYYGLTVEQYEAMWAEQDQKCAICRKPRADLVRPAVDHCHKTNLVRGLLCSKCNLGIGYFDDKPELLVQASEYLASKQEMAWPR